MCEYQTAKQYCSIVSDLVRFHRASRATPPDPAIDNDHMGRRKIDNEATADVALLQSDFMRMRTAIAATLKITPGSAEYRRSFAKDSGMALAEA